MSWRRLLITLFLSFVFLPTPAMADSPVSDLSQEFICQCGCTLTLGNCTHAECGPREAMITLIREKLAQGQSREQIIQFFVAQYGEKVLASPPKRGFNLVAWVLPFVGLLLGGGVIYIALRKWVWQGRRYQISVTAEGNDEKYRHQLEKELEEFNGGAFR